MNTKIKKYLPLGIIFLTIVIILHIYRGTSAPYYTDDYFKIKAEKSQHDKDNDNINDYMDIFLGAKKYVLTKPKYADKYYDGGYPTDNYGVCTDLIWYAFEQAGYDLKSLVDADIQNAPKEYKKIKKAEPNIDFRRVSTLNTFFERNAESLTTDLSQISQWQHGDIVVFKNHIAICSNKRNKHGEPFIIHFTKSGAREANEIKEYKIIGHYRWNG